MSSSGDSGGDDAEEEGEEGKKIMRGGGGGHGKDHGVEDIFSAIDFIEIVIGDSNAILDVIEGIYTVYHRFGNSEDEDSSSS